MRGICKLNRLEILQGKLKPSPNFLHSFTGALPIPSERSPATPVAVASYAVKRAPCPEPKILNMQSCFPKEITTGLVCHVPTPTYSTCFCAWFPPKTAARTPWFVLKSTQKWPSSSSKNDTLPETNNDFTPENRPFDPKRKCIIFQSHWISKGRL